MADSKITALNANSSPVAADLIATVDDVGGSAETKKTTIGELDDFLKSTTKTLTNKTIDGDDNTLQDIPYSAVKEASWSSYTPTLSGVTIGNGTTTGRYVQIGKVMILRLFLKIGSTTSVTGSVGFSIPATASSTSWEYLSGPAVVLDQGSATYACRLRMNSTSQITAMAMNCSGTYPVYSSVNGSVPMTWAENDILNGWIAYEVA